VTCPNHRDPLNWVPARLADLVNASGDYTKVSADLPRIRGRGKMAHADLLVCIDESNAMCVFGRRYVMGRQGRDANTTGLSSGLYRTQFIDVETLGAVDVLWPFWALWKVFRPVELVPNDVYNCGYWAFPYQTMEAIRRRNWDLFDNFKVSYIQVEFSNGSYARAKEAEGKDLSYLRNSTYRIEPVTFNGPIPFDLIYG
jgi:hypothetical protein